MAIFESLIGPITSLLDKLIPDKEARARAQYELLQLEGTQEMQLIEARLQAIVAEAHSTDPWTSRARPSFLYVMYVLLLWSIPMGVIAAWRHGSLTDNAVMAISVLGFSIPVFVTGYIFIQIFAIDLRLLPVQGFRSVFDGVGPFLARIVLPAFTLATIYIALIARMTRAAMLEVLDEDYIRTARAKGLTERIVLFRHALRNAAVPILTVVGTGFALAAWSLYDMTTWSLEMGAMPFIVAGLIQGLGMGLIFMPLNGMAFATLPAHQRTEAASLTNLSRNIGASIGISLVTTILARSTQVSHADLAPNITAERLQTLDPGLLANFGSQTDALLAMANAEVTRQAAMIAYLNDFHAMMIVTAASIPLVLFLKRPKAPIAHDPAAAGH